MSKNACDLLKSFDEWFNELEGYSFRSERILEEVKALSNESPEHIVQQIALWLQHAYLQGARQMAHETVDVLGDWGTAMAGVREPLTNPTEKFDEVAAELELFYHDTFLEVEDKLNEAN